MSTAGSGKVIPLPEEHDLHLSALYHQTEAPRPGPELEQRILTAAREAAAEAARQRQARSRRRVPLPLAALLLVAAGLLPLLLWHAYQGGFHRPPVLPVAEPVEGPAASPPEPALPEPPLREEAAAGSSPEERELAAIQGLIEAGRDAEAWARFGDFRTRFPDHRIPDALLDRLAEVRLRLLEAAGEP